MVRAAAATPRLGWRSRRSPPGSDRGSRPPERVTRDYERTPESLAAFAAETDSVLTDTGAMALAFER